MEETLNNVKEVKQSTLSKNFYLIVYNYLKSGKTIQDVLFDYSISKQKLQYYINRLKERKVIKKVGYGTWEIIKQLDIKEVKKEVKQSTHDGMRQPYVFRKEVRGHGFMFRLQIPKLYNWNKRSTYMNKHNIKYSNIHSNGHKLIILGKTVHLFTNSIIIYDKYSYISNLAKESKSKAIYEFTRIIKRIETMFKVNLKINKGYKFKVLKEHYGLIKNALARQYNENGEKLHVYNSDGLWLVIDNSFNLDELETQKNRNPEPDHAINDNEVIQEFFNDLRQHKGFTPTFVLNAFGMYAQNIISHVSAIKELGKGVKDLTKVVKELKNESFK